MDKLIAQAGSAEFIQAFKNSNMYAKQFTNEAFLNGTTAYVQNTYIDCLNKASSAEWQSIADKFPSLAADVSNTVAKLDEYNNFLGLNIANSPSFILKDSFQSGAYGMIIAALMIPFLAAFTQWLNVKLMPQPETKGDGSTQDSMAASMKTMNLMMPIMSAVFCFTLPAGMGIYWIAGAVVRSFQQIFINRHIDKIDMDEIIKKNLEKREKKLEKMGVAGKNLNGYASMNTKKATNAKSLYTQEEKDAALKKAEEYYNNKELKAGSIAAKANLVKQYNEKNNK